MRHGLIRTTDGGSYRQMGEDDLMVSMWRGSVLTSYRFYCFERKLCSVPELRVHLVIMRKLNPKNLGNCFSTIFTVFDTRVSLYYGQCKLPFNGHGLTVLVTGYWVLLRCGVVESVPCNCNHLLTRCSHLSSNHSWFIHQSSLLWLQ
jgi:hypothetical protein